MTWLLTWTTYGTRLPGDPRGFVSRVRTASGESVVHNEPGTVLDADMPGLQRFAGSIMSHPAVLLTTSQANTVLSQFRETAAHRRWLVLAVAVLTNHVHLVVEAPDDNAGGRLLADFKAYATRRLDNDFRNGVKNRWWTERGSTRPLKHPDAVLAAVEYVKTQSDPLIIWLSEPASD